MQKTSACRWHYYACHRSIARSLFAIDFHSKESLRTARKILFAMKLTAILLMAGFLNVAAKGISQNVTFSGKDVTLPEIFTAIEKQTGLVFFYERGLLDNASKISIKAKDVPLVSFMNDILSGQPYQFSIESRTITISRKLNDNSGEKPSVNNILAVDPPVKGRVLSEDGAPLAGASVTVKGKKVSVTTDAEGFFSINANTGEVLIISYVGYSGKQITVGSTIGTVTLEKSQSKLDEVQIVAYGTNTQRYQVGSVSKVTSKEIEKQPVANIFAALQGKSPGLLISTTSGLPGAAFKVQIRGQNSLNPNSNGIAPFDNPLIVVDGVPLVANNNNLNQMSSIVSTPALAYKNPYSGLSPLNTINPLDIESVEVLRDADATAIYGSRAANGVLLITTKKGAQGKTKVTASVYSGQNHVTKSIEMMNTQQYITMRREALANDGLNATVSNAPDLLRYDTTKYTNWKEKFLGRSSSTLDANMSVDGGSANTQFLLGAGYHKETFILPGDFNDYRVNFKGNINHRSADKKLGISFSNSFSYWSHNSSGKPDALMAFTTIPNHPDFIDSNGNYTWSYKGVSHIGFRNPLAFLGEKYIASTYSQISHVEFNYLLVNNLNFRTSVGYNSLESDENSQRSIRVQNPASNPTGKSSFGSTSARSWIAEPQLEWKQKISKGKLLLLVGSSFQKNNNKSTLFGAYGYTNDLMLGSLASAPNVEKTSASDRTYKYSSLFGRLNFTWNDEYIFNLNGRRDASSRFGPHKRVGNFGSVAAGWIFTKNSLLNLNSKWLSFGKIRASYGTTGSDAIGDYQYLDYWQLYQGNNYANIPGYYPSNLYNPDYSWAVTKKLEAGLELGLLNNNILFNGSYYRNRCGNQLIAYALPGQTGFFTVVQNSPALVENSGIELSVNTQNIKTKNFKWTSDFNITIPKNKLVDFPGLETSSYYQQYFIGKSLNTVLLFHYTGINPQTGIFEFETKSGNSNEPDLLTDRNTLIQTGEKLYGGFNNTFSYGQFQLSVLLDFRKQTAFNYLGAIYGNGIGGRAYNQPTIILDRWQKPGDIATFQKYSSRSSGDVVRAGQNFVASDGAYSDASFIRFRNISLSYSFTNTSKVISFLRDLRVYVNCQNLFTITKFKLLDPESPVLFGVPPVKTIVAGIQLSL
ncbi:MAG: SusC/RagA family TonB-linked outer membrane protein [Chitinophagaceae bacterium]|nr:SusC/RagA family TonB-linked outer membrane protein [Chitinophagaceae bacterium]